jgi:hypothetical protein
VDADLLDWAEIEMLRWRRDAMVRLGELLILIKSNGGTLTDGQALELDDLIDTRLLFEWACTTD